MTPGGELQSVYDALCQAQDCIRGETPEDVSDAEAREDTISKVREAMRAVEAMQSHGIAYTLERDRVGLEAEIERLRGAAQAAPKPECKADFYALWCDECNTHPMHCKRAQPASIAYTVPIGFMQALDIVEDGFNNWKGKAHNAIWWKRIDGTPIPNDLMVNIAEAISRASLVRPGLAR